MLTTPVVMSFAGIMAGARVCGRQPVGMKHCRAIPFRCSRVGCFHPLPLRGARRCHPLLGRPAHAHGLLFAVVGAVAGADARSRSCFASVIIRRSIPYLHLPG